MFNHVNFDQDLAGLIPILRGAYEKANIHAGYDNRFHAHRILDKEFSEVTEELECVEQLIRQSDCEGYYARIPNLEELDALEASTIRAMCEEVQILAVCKKMRQMYEREEEKCHH